MNYNKKAEEIYNTLKNEIHNLKWQFPLIREMLERKQETRKEYFARINYNLAMHGKSPLVFEDLDYSPFSI